MQGTLENIKCSILSLFLLLHVSVLRGQEPQTDRGNLNKKGNLQYLQGPNLLLVGTLDSGISYGVDSFLLSEGIGNIIQEGLDSMAFPGAQVLVAFKGEVVFHKAWGWHTYDKKQPVKLDDIYDLASVTKVAASLPAIMKLYGEGKLSLDAPIRKYFPAFRFSRKGNLTLRRMLTHTAGLKAWIPFWRNTKLPDGHFKNRTFRPDSSGHYPLMVADDLFLHRHYRKKIFRSIRKSPLADQGKYLYSDLSFYLYPEIVERLTGQPFESYLRDNFYEPLGAQTLRFNAYQHFPLERIVPTEQDTFFRMSLLHGRVHDEGAAMLNGISGHAGLFGSARDLAKLFQMYLNGGTYKGQRFLDSLVLEEFTSCPYCDQGIHRGIGFDKPLTPYDPVKSSSARSVSPRAFGHSGYTGTLVWADPENEILYIFLSNRVHPNRENRKIYDMNIRPRIQEVIYRELIGEKE